MLRLISLSLLLSCSLLFCPSLLQAGLSGEEREKVMNDIGPELRGRLETLSPEERDGLIDRAVEGMKSEKPDPPGLWGRIWRGGLGLVGSGVLSFIFGGILAMKVVGDTRAFPIALLLIMAVSMFYATTKGWNWKDAEFEVGSAAYISELRETVSRDYEKIRDREPPAGEPDTEVHVPPAQTGNVLTENPSGSDDDPGFRKLRDRDG